MNTRLGNYYKLYFNKIATIIDKNGKQLTKLDIVFNKYDITSNTIPIVFRFMGTGKADNRGALSDCLVMCIKDNDILDKYIFAQGAPTESLIKSHFDSWYSLDSNESKHTIVLLKYEIERNIISAIDEYFENPSKVSVSLDGMHCNYCTNFYNYAIANEPNNILKCYSCRKSNVIKRML